MYTNNLTTSQRYPLLKTSTHYSNFLLAISIISNLRTLYAQLGWVTLVHSVFPRLLAQRLPWTI
jgi:hypothetical protein